MHTLDAGAHVTAVACPKLVPLIEAGDTYSDEVVAAVREYAAPLKEAGCDTVILGCTHYPLLRPVFQRAFGRDVTLVFSADETAREVAETLARKGFENDAAREGAYRFLTTGDPALFRALGERFLQLPLGDVEQVERRRTGGGRMSRATTGAGPTSFARSTADPAFLEQPHGVVLWSQGKTRVLCTASVQDGVPRWLYRSGRGWMTAEYSLLPASTGERTDREAARGKQGGRTVEIQRLIGRALRGVVDFQALGERTVYLDCDVLQADGGTRCAAISGAYVAAQSRARPLRALEGADRRSVAAVSVGVVDGDVAARPRLLGGLERRRRRQRRHDRRRPVRRGAGDGGAGAVRPRAARRAARPRRGRDRGARSASSEEAIDAPRE